VAERVGFELTVRYLSRLSPVISAIIRANEQLSCSEMTGFRGDRSVAVVTWSG
jgi:hypothetical protein